MIDIADIPAVISDIKKPTGMKKRGSYQEYAVNVYLIRDTLESDIEKLLEHFASCLVKGKALKTFSVATTCIHENETE